MVWGCFSSFGQSLLRDIPDNSLLLTLWQQFGEGPFLFQHDNAPMHKARPIQKCCVAIGVEELETGMHRALTSTPSNTFGMNWNADCEPSLIVQHQCLISLMLLWLNGSKSLQQ